MGISPILAGRGIQSGLMETEILHICTDSQIAVIQLGQRTVGLCRS
jgi:hypothetical protein